MFSFAGDWIIDPFMGQGSTNAAIAAGRNSIGNELEKPYFDMAWNKTSRMACQTRRVGAVTAVVNRVELPPVQRKGPV